MSRRATTRAKGAEGAPYHRTIVQVRAVLLCSREWRPTILTHFSTFELNALPGFWGYSKVRRVEKIELNGLD